MIKEKILYGIDWATKKDLAISNSDKVKFVPATTEAFSKFLNSLNGNKIYQLYFEEGGGDSFKLLAKRNNFKVFTTIGKNVSDKREELGLEKNDENDAKLIFEMAKSEPERFREFNELDEITAKICIIFKGRSDTEENLIRAKNRLFSLNKRLELLDLGKSKLKLIKQKEKVIKELEKDFKLQTNELGKLVEHHPIWKNYLKDIKGIGSATAGGLIAGIKRASKFNDKYSLRQYAGMVKKKGNQNFNHKLKKALYYFAEGIIKVRTPIWRPLYDDMKIYYKEKHSDWKKGKINNYAMKFVETKFLDELYKKMIEVENAT